MLIKELVEKLNSKYSFTLAEDWDNVGLLVGNSEEQVDKVLTTLDVDIDICIEAVTRGCNVIVSHHPLFAFDPLKSITFDTYNGTLVKYIIENNLNIIAMHTNVDNLNGSVSKWIAENLGLTVNETFYIDGDKQTGVVCNVELNYKQLLDLLKTKYKINYIGNEEKIVKKVAIVSGSGSFLLDYFTNSDVDVFITGDLKYHDFHDMFKLNKCVVDIGHFAENIFSTKVLEDIDVEYCCSARKCVINN